MKIKCDEVMRRRKIRGRWEPGTWRCTGDCQRCICGMVLKNGVWGHIAIGELKDDVLPVKPDRKIHRRSYGNKKK